MNVCLFCNRDDSMINRIFLQSENFYVRWDNYPAAIGHAEIVPKRHVVSLFDLSPSEAAEAHELARQAAKQITATHAPDGFTVGVNEGRAAGRSIDHLHIHLIPRFIGDVDDPRGGIRRAATDGAVVTWQQSEVEADGP